MNGGTSFRDSDKFKAFQRRCQEIAHRVTSEDELPDEHMRQRVTNESGEINKRVQNEMTELTELSLQTYLEAQMQPIQDLVLSAEKTFLDQLQIFVAQADLSSVHGVKSTTLRPDPLRELSFLDSRDTILIFMIVDSDTAGASEFCDTVGDIWSKLSTNVFPRKFKLHTADNVLSIRAAMAVDIVAVPNTGDEMSPSSEWLKVYLQTQRLSNQFHDETGWCKRFAILFRTVQLWAKRRHIRGGEYGYLSRHDILCTFEDFQKDDRRPVLTLLKTLLDSLQRRASKRLFGDVIDSEIRDGIALVDELNTAVHSHREFVRKHPFRWVEKCNLRILSRKIALHWETLFKEAYWFRPNQQMLLISTHNDALTRLHLLKLLENISMIENIGRLRPWNQPILRTDFSEVLFTVSILGDIQDTEKLRSLIRTLPKRLRGGVKVAPIGDFDPVIASTFGGQQLLRLALVDDAEILLRKAATIASELSAVTIDVGCLYVVACAKSFKCKHLVLVCRLTPTKS